jgi:hypothetical protein
MRTAEKLDVFNRIADRIRFAIPPAAIPTTYANYQNTVGESGSRHSRQNNSGHDATDATEAQPKGQVMQRDTQRCSDACADRDRKAKFVLPISHGLCATRLQYRVPRLSSRVRQLFTIRGD